MLNIHHIEPSNYVNGVGGRYVIWVQGCSLGCVDCWNKQTWSTKEKILMSVDEIFQDISKQKGIQGVTFSGGEPFSQAEELCKLAELIKQRTDLSLHIFTGFELQELKSYSQKRMAELADTIVYGRFDKSKDNNNQKVIQQLDGHDRWVFNNSDIEVDISKDGSLTVTGYPSTYFISKIKEANI